MASGSPSVKPLTARSIGAVPAATSPRSETPRVPASSGAVTSAMTGGTAFARNARLTFPLIVEEPARNSPTVLPVLRIGACLSEQLIYVPLVIGGRQLNVVTFRNDILLGETGSNR